MGRAFLSEDFAERPQIDRCPFSEAVSRSTLRQHVEQVPPLRVHLLGRGHGVGDFGPQFHVWLVLFSQQSLARDDSNSAQHLRGVRRWSLWFNLESEFHAHVFSLRRLENLAHKVIVLA